MFFTTAEEGHLKNNYVSLNHTECYHLASENNELLGRVHFFFHVNENHVMSIIIVKLLDRNVTF